MVPIYFLAKLPLSRPKSKISGPERLRKKNGRAKKELKEPNPWIMIGIIVITFALILLLVFISIVSKVTQGVFVGRFCLS